MKILIVGTGKGSWSIRGLQLGAALGARVSSNPTEAEILWADVVVLVKRAGAKWSRYVHQLNRPIVWDALDCWDQPAMHRYTESKAIAWLQSQIAFIRPEVTIGATEAMARAANGVYLPHHGWSGLTPTPAREKVQMVAYEGNPMYLGKWAGAITTECKKRGWQFVLNPPDLSQADILVAFRDGQWDGWICREWKSGVKIVNAICAGRPILTQFCEAVNELEPLGTTFEDMSQVGFWLDYWASPSVRQEAVDSSLKRVAEFDIHAIADRYQQILSDACKPIVREQAWAH